MDIKQIKKHLSLKTRFRAWLSFFFQKIKKDKQNFAILYFSGQSLKICGFKAQGGAASISFLKTAKLPENLYDFRTASILNLKETISLLKTEKKGLPQQSAARKAIIVLPQECVFSKLVGVQSESEAEIEKASGQMIFNNGEKAARWRRIAPLDGKDEGHLDMYFEAISGDSARAFYECVFKGLKFAPSLFLSEAEAIAAYFFPSFESKDANLIIKLDENRVLFVIFAGRAIQFSATDFIGSKDFENNDENIAAFVEKTANIVDFYRNQVLHEHGASPFVNRTILLCGAELKDLLTERLFSSIEIKAEWIDADTILEFPKDFDVREKMGLMPILGAAKILQRKT